MASHAHCAADANLPCLPESREFDLKADASRVQSGHLGETAGGASLYFMERHQNWNETNEASLAAQLHQR
jgi:hypothetical protein